MEFATKAIRVGQDPDCDNRAVVNPIWQSATFAWEDLDHIPAIDYTRCTNPNRISLEQALASLENGKYCTAFASGMAAITAALSLLENGDHLLMASDIYGGTYRLVHKLLPKQGITCTEFDARDLASIQSAIQPNTKLVIFESPTNPNLRVCDIRAIVEIAKRHGLTTVFDNTFASPALQNPLDLGVDVVVHSTTKYISGHSDVIGGAVVTNDPDIALHVYEWNKTVGAVPAPLDAWLSVRGLKTLQVRMERHCQNAQAVAEFLEGHAQVAKVHFPGLPSHPDHEIAKRQMRGFGGMVTFEIAGTADDARTFAESTRIFLLAESLGGVESLIGYPPLMSHATMSEEERLERGIPNTMLRLSVGIEDIKDIIDDLKQAFAKVAERKLSHNQSAATVSV
jgi:cystathionine beta-lyase/cystathionine gamma-synthase